MGALKEEGRSSLVEGGLPGPWGSSAELPEVWTRPAEARGSRASKQGTQPHRRLGKPAPY